MLLSALMSPPVAAPPLGAFVAGEDVGVNAVAAGDEAAAAAEADPRVIFSQNSHFSKQYNHDTFL